MEVLVPNTVESIVEKHLPVVIAKGGVVHVAVGSVAHSMIPKHSIQWGYLQTENGGHRKVLNPCDVEFVVGNDKPVTVYTYCNLHGLWMTEV